MSVPPRRPARPIRWTARLALAVLALAAAALLIVPLAAQDRDRAADPPAPEAAEPAAPAAAPPAGPPGAMPGPPPAVVRFGAVERRTVQERWEVVGRLQEVRRAVVASEGTGRVEAIDVDAGTPVLAGQTVLARIDDTWARLDLDQARGRLAEIRAQVSDAEAQLDLSTRDLARHEALRAGATASIKEVDDARARVKSDRARLEAALAAVVTAEATLRRAQEYADRLVIVAPFDGLVVQKLTEVGQWLTAGAAVAEIVSRGPIDAVIDVPERLVNHMTLGAEVPVVIEALREERVGQVAAINPVGARAARTFAVKVRLDDGQGTLRPGMSVLARVPTGEAVEALTVPRDAILRSDQGAMVWAERDGLAAAVPVRVLFGQEDFYVIEPMGGPLPPGTRVVIEGGESIRFPGRPLVASGAP